MFVPAHVEQSPAQRVVEAGILLPKYAAVTGWGALAWLGAHWFSGLRHDMSMRPVPIAMHRRLIRPQECLHLCEERWDPRESAVVDGLRVTSAVRSACFEVRYAWDLESAVALLDMTAYHDLASVEEIAQWVDTHPSYTGIGQAREAVPLMDENAWSPTEVSMRMEWVDTGHLGVLTNRPVFDLDGRHIGTPDLIDPETGVVGEYDGALHLEGGRRYADLGREHRFREHGLEPVTMVAGDLRDRASFRARLRQAYARADRVPATERRWTLERPAWWPATFTVEQRRRLTAEQREKWLRHRSAG